MSWFEVARSTGELRYLQFYPVLPSSTQYHLFFPPPRCLRHVLGLAGELHGLGLRRRHSLLRPGLARLNGLGHASLHRAHGSQGGGLHLRNGMKMGWEYERNRMTEQMMIDDR